MNESAVSDGAVSERQARERAYHEAYALKNEGKRRERVLLDVVESTSRRPWNAYWSTYDMLIAPDLKRARILVPGCGFGEDAIRLAKLGAAVYAFDLSEDLLDIARARAELMGTPEIQFGVMPAEALTYENHFFDAVFFNDILHHVNIPAALREIHRVLKPNGVVVANELYTHSILQRVCESRFVKQFLYRRMVRFIYGADVPYITEDEHKIDERELALLESYLQPNFTSRYFLLLGGRLLPANWKAVARLDHVILRCIGPLGRFFGGRVILKGLMR
jgi:2-polyprenyl-3-methyl-5-hydroxy-6-metoxy-1,4-benzoquinol methylase